MKQTPQSLGYGLLERMDRPNPWEEAVIVLLEKGADLSVTDEDGKTALIVAAENGHISIIRLLLDHGADIDARDHKNRTALIWAIHKGMELTAGALIERGAALELRDDYDGTALLYAARGRQEYVVRKLIDAGADPAAKDGQGRTPLETLKDDPGYFSNNSALGALRDAWRAQERKAKALANGMPVQNDIPPLPRLRLRPGRHAP